MPQAASSVLIPIGNGQTLDVEINASAVVSALALVFTIASFYKIHASKGRLRSYEPYSFAAISDRRVTQVRLPVMLTNTGASHAVVQDLRLVVLEGKRRQRPVLPWIGTDTQIRPVERENMVHPAIFAVPGRTSETVFAEFALPRRDFKLEVRDYEVQLEAKLARRELRKLDLRFDRGGRHRRLLVGR